MRIFSATNELQVPTAIALGNFDGVHRGHQAVLRQVVAFAQGHHPRLSPSVVSFNPHPRAFFSGQPQPLLTPLGEKSPQLEAVGMEQLIVLPFTPALARLDPPAFVQQVLVNQLQAQFISVGQDFRFGYQRQGTVETLQTLGSAWGITVAIAPLVQVGEERISSSQIRQALHQGDLQRANRLLGRPYRLAGTVVQGQQLGRKIGFPTANLALPADKLWPKFGVYSGWVRGLATTPLAAVLNLGDRPTVNGQISTAEVHILDWAGDLYGQKLQVDLHHYLRPEQKFPHLDALKDQIVQDCRQARQRLGFPPI